MPTRTRRTDHPIAGPRILLVSVAVALAASLGPAAPAGGEAEVAAITGPATGDEAAADDPFRGTRWFVDPHAAAAEQAAHLRTSDPGRAALLERIARRPQADWFGDWVRTDRLGQAVATRTATIRDAGGVPVYVTYAIPDRDCGGESSGGMASAGAYRDWVDAFASGLDGGTTVVVVEPDALAMLDCLAADARQARLDLLSGAVQRLREAGATVYLDAGHSGWHDTDEMAARLRAAGVADARGFALNVSNFQRTADEVAYARALSARTDGAHAVVDTSRNGRGPSDDGQWCNPGGRGLGPPPTTATADATVDAYLWVKRPGESDGTCGGGPSAGTWWPAHAEGLAARAVGDDPAAAGHELPRRVAGPDRVATAIAVARAGWEQADTVVLARGDDPADALAGTSLAGHLDAPLLVTDPRSLDPRVAEEVARLGARQVVVLGGAAAVTDAVVDRLHGRGLAVRRVAGRTRTETAVALAEEVTDAADTALLVHERAWPDALAVAGLSARRAAAGAAWPVLLAGESVPQATRDAIERLGVRRVLVVGGTAVLPASIDAALRGAGVAVERVAGPTRHATSAAAATLDLAGRGGGRLLLATSAGFADGLAAGALAARLGGIVLLVPPDDADPRQLAWVGRHRVDLTGTAAIGGDVAVSDVTSRAVERARQPLAM